MRKVNTTTRAIRVGTFNVTSGKNCRAVTKELPFPAIADARPDRSPGVSPPSWVKDHGWVIATSPMMFPADQLQSFSKGVSGWGGGTKGSINVTRDMQRFQSQSQLEWGATQPRYMVTQSHYQESSSTFSYWSTYIYVQRSTLSGGQMGDTFGIWEMLFTCFFFFFLVNPITLVDEYYFLLSVWLRT